MNSAARFALALALLAACDPDPIDPIYPDDIDEGGELSQTQDLADDWACEARPGSLGCMCPEDGCEENLICDAGLCVSCPLGNYGCECAAGECDAPFSCTDGVCG